MNRLQWDYSNDLQVICGIYDILQVTDYLMHLISSRFTLELAIWNHFRTCHCWFLSLVSPHEKPGVIRTSVQTWSKDDSLSADSTEGSVCLLGRVSSTRKFRPVLRVGIDICHETSRVESLVSPDISPFDRQCEQVNLCSSSKMISWVKTWDKYINISIAV
jgi:hypothetical protein